MQAAVNPPASEEYDRPSGWLDRWASLAAALPLLLSVCIHLSTMLALAWWMRPGRELAPIAEPLRHAGIVLAKVSANQPTEYLTEDSETKREATDSSPAAVGVTTADALPAESNLELPASAQLPTTAGIGLPDAGFLPGVDGVASANRRLPSGINEGAILAEDAKGRGTGQDTTGTVGGLTLFGAPARGRTFAMLIDRSASMGDQGLGAIRAAADEFARQMKSLDEQQRVQLIAYHAAPSQMNAHWLPATDQNKQKLVDYLRGLPAFGATNHTAALVAALKLRPEVIFLLTDGDDPGMDGAQLRIVRELARGRTTIHTIQFGRGSQAADSDHFMRRLANDTGGNYVYVDVDKLP
ncbi:von Willebrand factor type A domain protein [Anatilimnocola aggregata]|uniref:von Willebrand factor type A domain protein n=1 Tax=Anatilimnocola aggregata TaxID=2528021 RepID=A0A517YEH6_9BACT|nr:vWA domain-containing protein [Anatilimnocola aggregata]QDU28646.1 von Willebrand factor type A domain protein [Anatilimnocola aggregata]